MVATMSCSSKPLFECENSFHMQDDNTEATLIMTAVQVVQPLRLNFDGDIALFRML